MNTSTQTHTFTYLREDTDNVRTYFKRKGKRVNQQGGLYCIMNNGSFGRDDYGLTECTPDGEPYGIFIAIEPSDFDNLVYPSSFKKPLVTIQTLADQMLGQLQTKQRDNGDDFLCFKSTRQEWMQEVMFACHGHGEFLPDDYRYEFTQDALYSLSECDADYDNINMHEVMGEWADNDVHVDNHKLLKWLASNLQRPCYCDEARDEGLIEGSESTIKQLAIGQYCERLEVYGQLIEALADHVETLNDELEG